MAALSPLHVDGCARLGRMRLKAARLNVYEAWTGASIDGVPVGGVAGTGLRIEGATIQHVLNDQPDTAAFRVRGGTVPKAGQIIQVYSGDSDLNHMLFTGRIIETTLLYEGRKENVAREIRCVDPGWLMQRRAVLATYLQQSATAIVLDLISRFTRGITVGHVAAGLPLLDAITFTNEQVPQCLTAICERIGASWYVDDNFDLHLFVAEPEPATPIQDHAPRGAANLALAEDLSQVATRVIGRGGGVNAAMDVAVGATELPVNEGDAASWYDPAGGLVEVNTQVIAYTGVRGRGGVGALVGTGNTPTTPLTISGISGAGLGTGTYQYAQTFTNAVGETLPGPLKSIVVGGSVPALNVPAMRATFSQGTHPQSGMVPGGSYSWRVAILYGGGGFALGPPTPYHTVNQYPWEMGVGQRTIDPVSGFAYYPSLQTKGYAEIIQLQILRTTNGGATWYMERTAMGVVTTAAGWLVTANGWDDANLVNQSTFPYPGGSVATFAQNAIRAPLPAPSDGFTGTNLYRTVVNGAQLKRLATNPNPAIDYIDGAADGTLGANAPAADTSGVVASSSTNIQPGATEIVVTSTAPFVADGGAGWARIGDLVVRYTGIGTNRLTGVPAGGAGAITAAIRYGAQILVQPRLVGIPTAGTGAILAAIKKGDTVTIRVEVQDDAAIAFMAERLKFPGAAAVTLDGVIEIALSDSRFGVVELMAHCRAKLAERKDPTLTLTYTIRDDSHRVGRLVAINTATPPMSGVYRIQRITFSEIAISGARGTARPLRTVEATNKLFTFANLLRQLRGRESGVP